MTGSASQFFPYSFRDTRNACTVLVPDGNWQFLAVRRLREALQLIDGDVSGMHKKVNIRHWFHSFVELRNKTRGHGAPTPALCARLADKLGASISVLCSNNPIFDLPWAYLHRYFSGKYRVIPLNAPADAFNKLKGVSDIDGPHYPNGVYIWVDGPRHVELLTTDLDTRDFFFPNGAFRGQTYELHSLITDNRIRGDAGPYMAPVGGRPASESEGKATLEELGNVLTNIPNRPVAYVQRPQLESEVYNALINDRHAIVTLAGRGGIGKTSLVLTVLHALSVEKRYDLIFWFSARDIDLTTSGPKLVRPHLQTQKDLDAEYCSLVGESDASRSGGRATDNVLASAMQSQPYGCALYVFDNFETVLNPHDLYEWIDNNIRLPNKVVITTRFRDFAADFPITVSGMERPEAELLIDQTARMLGVESKLRSDYVDAVYEQSDGHPYIIKVLLGEMSGGQSLSKPERVIARKEDVLEALFERTYQNLSPVAARILLTLSRWRSLVPQLAAEAMLLRHDYGSENIDPETAIDQLVRMSLVERIVGSDGSDFLRVPLSAALFCKRKLDVSPDHALIEEDFRFLYDFGATSVTVRNPEFHGRMTSFFKRTASKVVDGDVNVDSVRPIVAFFARHYSRAWLLMADLEEEVSGPERAAECVRRFLESGVEQEEAGDAWRRLAELYQRSGDALAGCSAFLKAAEVGKPTLEEVSRMANLVNGASYVRDRMDIQQRRTILEPLARLMESFREAASATDLSRLAWLYLHCGRSEEALKITKCALQREPENIHGLRLRSRLSQARVVQAKRRC